MNTTALNKLINTLTESRDVYNKNDVKYGIYSNIINYASLLLLAEKTQIVESYREGQKHILNGLQLKLTDGLNYYKENYITE